MNNGDLTHFKNFLLLTCRSAIKFEDYSFEHYRRCKIILFTSFHLSLYSLGINSSNGEVNRDI